MFEVIQMTFLSDSHDWVRYTIWTNAPDQLHTTGVAWPVKTIASSAQFSLQMLIPEEVWNSGKQLLNQLH